MDHEFGYIDDKPFKTCYRDKQLFSLITTNDQGMEFDVTDTLKFSCIFGEDERTDEVYAVDDKLRAISAFRARTTKSTFSAIPKSIIKSDLYFIEQRGTNDDEYLKHFTRETKIRQIDYYNDGIFRLFFNESLTLSYKLNKDRSIKSASLKAIKKKDIKLGDVEVNDNRISLYLGKNWSFSHKPSIRQTTFNDKSNIIIKFKKGVQFAEAYKYILILDAVIYLLTLSTWRHNKVFVYNFSGNKYYCKDKKAQTDETKPKIKEFYLHDRSQIVQVFVNAFDNICRIEKDSKNALFPILNYDDNHHSLEISFLEHYKTLEYIKTEENKAKGKGKCTTFLLNILKDNQSLKNRFFGNQPEQEIEQEIRNLRNYYSHTGFYIDDKLPIEKNYKVIRYKDIDNKWLFNVFEFVKIATYIEIYKKCGIDIKWSDIINYL